MVQKPVEGIAILEREIVLHITRALYTIRISHFRILNDPDHKLHKTVEATNLQDD